MRKKPTNNVELSRNSKIWSVIYMVDDVAEITEPNTLKKAKEAFEQLSDLVEGARIVCFPSDKHLKD
jgi:hypothetical protein